VERVHEKSSVAQGLDPGNFIAVQIPLERNFLHRGQAGASNQPMQFGKKSTHGKFPTQLRF